MRDDYARNEGTTWGVIRGECSLDPSPEKTDIPKPRSVKEVDREKMRLIELIDALATVSLDQNTDVQRKASCLGSFWGNLSAPHPGKSPKVDTRYLAPISNR